MSRVLPPYMSMGSTGMGEMGAMGMPVPPNSLPMRGGKGPYGSIDMGGMFTLLKVREDAATADPNGWYAPPPGTLAGPATDAALAADGVKRPSPPSVKPTGGHEGHPHQGHNHAGHAGESKR
jgi:hypothetical protein